MLEICRRITLGSLCLLVLTVGGCGGSTDTAPTVQPFPTALRGSFITTLSGSGERVTLTITEGNYQIDRGSNRASGRIAVSGDRIEFSQSTACSGLGAYKWSVSGTSLLFTSLGADQCPGRSEVLAGYTYTKSG